MNVTLTGNKLIQTLSIEDALALQAGLAKAISSALKYTIGSTSLTGIGESLAPNGKPVPLAIIFNVESSAC
jgi:hypothetical protein